MQRIAGRRCWLLSALLAFAGLASLAAGESKPELLGHTPEQWLTRLQSSQPQERTEAAWAIAQLAPDDPQWAAKLLSSDDATVRYWGLQGLQRTNGVAPGAVLPLLADKSPAVRIAAAETIGLLGDPARALPVLASAMNHPQDAVRIQAVAALEKLGPAARPAEKTLQAATSDSSEYVKRISARALQKLNSPGE